MNNIDYRNTGVILRVAPRITANGSVLLDVEQEISAVADTPTASTLTPTVSQRKVRSSIGVANGQTVLLAGLISERENRTRLGIPGLEQIPYLGDVFAHTNGTLQRTELIVFIRPKIIRNGIDAYRVAQELRDKMRGFMPYATAAAAAAADGATATAPVSARGPTSLSNQQRFRKKGVANEKARRSALVRVHRARGCRAVVLADRAVRIAGRRWLCRQYRCGTGSHWLLRDRPRRHHAGDRRH